MLRIRNIFTAKKFDKQNLYVQFQPRNKGLKIDKQHVINDYRVAKKG